MKLPHQGQASMYNWRKVHRAPCTKQKAIVAFHFLRALRKKLNVFVPLGAENIAKAI